MSKQWFILSALTTLSLGSTQIACTQVECGTGTLERDGECVAAEEATNGATCGPGTVIQNGRCVPKAICDPGTTTQEESPPGSGVFICKGSGEFTVPADCTLDYVCPPTSDSTKVNLCGRLFEVDTDGQIIDSGAGKACGSTSSGDGACSLAMEYYDAVDYATKPAPTQLKAENAVFDSCGRFRVVGLDAPPNMPFVAVGAKPYGNNRKTTGILVPATGGLAVSNIRGYSTKTSVDTAWSTMAGETSMAAKGVIVSIFSRGGKPLSGISYTVGGAKYYFSDTDPTKRTTINKSQTSTGANGVGLLLGLDNPGAVDAGPAPNGCDGFGSPLGKTLANTVVVMQRPALMGNGLCPAAP